MRIKRRLRFCDSQPVFAHGRVIPASSADDMEGGVSLDSRCAVTFAFDAETDRITPRPNDAATLMNRMYRRQRHIYDATRRYYLLGRDDLIDGLDLKPGETVLEIGCGTGRNLIETARRYPAARCRGIDISTEMLTSAIAAIDRHGLTDRIRVAHGDATRFAPDMLFGQARFERVMISYSLSMIPQWHDVLERAIRCLRPGGRLHVVDFGGQEHLPRPARALLRRWLALFGVTPRDDLETVLRDTAMRIGASLTCARPYRGYAQHLVLTLPG